MATAAFKKKKFDVNQISVGSNLAINSFFWIYTALCVFPLLLVIAVSFSDEKTVLISGYSFWPEKWSIESYKFLFNDYMAIVKSYGVSIFVTVVGTAISLTIMTMYAYPISRRDFKHRNLFSFLMFFTILFNSGLVPFYLVYKQGLHLQNTMLVLMIPLFVQGFFVFVIRTFFQNQVPPALIESAKIDGAGELRTFSRSSCRCRFRFSPRSVCSSRLTTGTTGFSAYCSFATTGRRRFNSGCTARCSTSSISAPTPRHTRPSCKRIRTSRCRAKQREWRWHRRDRADYFPLSVRAALLRGRLDRRRGQGLSLASTGYGRF
ncbi:carbohydrate ABC transporter permease [Cohnella faecalis]|uniref:carbohydrate ABC transporter permease n=1 Tax=Cohnella faecalis TaxID=2315694 RepID=UPI001F16D5D2|nr:carbohydrate ABC transporter permease [Cohnella faecalis]